MEGGGPLYGKRVEMNVLLAGLDPLNVDIIAARIMGMECDQGQTYRLFAEARDVKINDCQNH